MILHVKAAKYLHDYVLWVRFNDGAEGEVDLADELEGEVFAPLKKLSVFRALRVHPILQTVVWPNDADLAPEFLYSKMVPSGMVKVRSSKSQILAVHEAPAEYTTRRSTKSKGMRRRAMNPRVKAVVAMDNYRLRLRFDNDEERIYDVKPLMELPVFLELRNPRRFRSVRASLGTVCWAGGQDVCPDTLYMDSVPVARSRTSGKKRALRASSGRGKP